MNAAMQFPPSPYRPGVGAEPPVFSGRREIMDAVSRRMLATATYGTAAPAPYVLVGVRGMGKTVALNRLRDRAQEMGFVAAHARFSAGDGTNNTQAIAESVARAVARERVGDGVLGRRAGRHLEEFSVELNAGIVKVGTKLGRGDAPSGRLTDLLSAALEDVQDRAGSARGLALFIDELHTGSRDDLNAVAGAAQDLIADTNTPFVMVTAGTPDTGPAIDRAGSSFSERFSYLTVGPLTRDEAFEALVRPSTTLDVRWAEDAVEAALDAAQGNPWRIQQLGDAAWNIAEDMGQPIGVGSVIDLPLVQQAKEHVTHVLGTGSFRNRWISAAPTEKTYLTAMAQTVDDRGVARTQQVNALMSRTAQQNSEVRATLITKGLITSSARGEVQFSTPGFDEYVRNAQDVERLAPESLEAHEPKMTPEEQRAYDRVQKLRAAALPRNAAERVARGHGAATERGSTTGPAVQDNDRPSAPDQGHGF